MKTTITQPFSAAWHLSRRMLPALLTALFSLSLLTAGAQVWTIGTGTSYYSQYSTAPNSPLGYYIPTARTQFIYKASELIAAGMPSTGCTIHQLAWNNFSNNSAMVPAPNFRVSMGHTTLSALSTTTGYVTPSTLVYSATAGISYTTGWNTLTLQTPFAWNGVDNIVVDVCHSVGMNTYSTSGGSSVYYSSVTGSGLYYSGANAANACGTTATTNVTANRPNVRFTQLLPCNLVTAGTLTPSGITTTLCPGTRVNLLAQGYTAATSMVYEWFEGNTATGPWTLVATGTDRYTTPPLVTSKYYYFKVTCLNSGKVDSTAKSGFTFATGPSYGALPYFESFESWINGCANSDKIASGNWTNIPPTGSGTWRRHDQVSTASPTSTTTQNQPVPIHGSYMARWLAYYTTPGSAGEGTLNLYLDFSTHPGPKDLEFYYDFTYPASSAAYADDSLNVEMSTDGGATFSPLSGGQFGWGNMIGNYAKWNFMQIKNLISNSATTVIRFRAKHGYQYGYDHYMDAVRVIPPCTGRPTAGKIDTVKTCSGKSFKLSLTGTSKAAGLTYLWQYLPAGATVWQDLPGGTVASPTAIISTNTSFRAVVTCTNVMPNVGDTSAVWDAVLSPFYFCYCNAPSSITQSSIDYNQVGNVKISSVASGAVLFDYGIPTPLTGNVINGNLNWYNDYANIGLPIPSLILDSTYRFAAVVIGGATGITPSGNYSPLSIWVDFNRDGVFANAEAVVNNKPLNSTGSIASQTLASNFTVPSGAGIGLTGMRVMTGYYSPAPNPMNPCGGFYYPGEVEDYLVRIEYQPCTGPVNAGTSASSDTSVCPGYTVDLSNTTYEKTRTGILRDWEVSVNGGASYSVIPNSSQKDTMFNVVVTTGSQYRLRVRCTNTGDTTFSNVLVVRTPEPVRCYPVSQPAIGNLDSSDIGAVILGDRLINPNPALGGIAGPHLMNPQARKRRTDFTLIPPTELEVDSTYRLAIFHTMPGANHADAMVSVYMDFNNDLKYDQTVSGPPFTSELVYQGLTTAGSFFLDTKITIPNAVIPNVRTGMRVVINNNVSSPTAPGNNGSGNFTSGEVEDYLIIFRRTPLGVNTAGLQQNLALYPNPTEGKFTVTSDAVRPVSHMDVVVSTITGQQVISRSFDNVGKHFSTDIDLTGKAKGIYFVEISADGEKITRKLVVR